MEFSADKEFYGNYLNIRNDLLRLGWKENTPKKDGRTISVLFTRDGYGIYLLYGCEEEIRNEIL